jgi:hypothetical protein
MRSKQGIKPRPNIQQQMHNIIPGNNSWKNRRNKETSKSRKQTLSKLPNYIPEEKWREMIKGGLIKDRTLEDAKSENRFDLRQKIPKAQMISGIKHTTSKDLEEQEIVQQLDHEEYVLEQPKDLYQFNNEDTDSSTRIIRLLPSIDEEEGQHQAHQSPTYRRSPSPYLRSRSSDQDATQYSHSSKTQQKPNPKDNHVYDQRYGYQSPTFRRSPSPYQRGRSTIPGINSPQVKYRDNGPRYRYQSPTFRRSPSPYQRERSTTSGRNSPVVKYRDNGSEHSRKRYRSPSPMFLRRHQLSPDHRQSRISTITTGEYINLPRAPVPQISVQLANSEFEMYQGHDGDTCSDTNSRNNWWCE